MTEVFRNKKVLQYIGVTLGAVGLSFAACKETPKEAPKEAAKAEVKAPAAPAEPQTFLIGQIAPLTGDIATYGVSANNGLNLAVKELNEKGGINGKKIVVKVLDSQGKAPDSAIAATTLIAKDKANIIMGEIVSTNTLAMTPIADENQIPLVATASTNVAVTVDKDGKVRPYVFRTCFVDDFQGWAIANYVWNDRKLKTAAVLTDVGSDFSKGLSKVFVERYKELGGKIIGEWSFKGGDVDFKAQLTAIKGKKPEVIFLPANYTEVGNIARQAKQLGMKIPFAGSDTWDSEKTWEIAQGALDGSFFTNHYSAQSSEPVVAEFVKRYKAAYNDSTPDTLAVLAYDAAYLIADAASRAKDFSGPSLREALAATKDFKGVTGAVSFDEKHNPVKAVVIIGVEKNKPKYLATVNPEAAKK